MVGRRSREWTEAQMMALNPTTSSPATEPRVGIAELLELLNSAPAAKEFLAKIKAVHAQERKRLEEAKLQIEQEHANYLAEQAREAAEVLAKDRSDFAKERAEFSKERDTARAELDTERKYLAAARETVAAKDADLNQRLRNLREIATTSP
jgi:hypothetical protein